MSKPNITIREIIELMEFEDYIINRDEVLDHIKCGHRDFIEAGDTDFKVILKFTGDKRTWVRVPLGSPILTAYYDVVPESIEPIDEETLGIWIRDEDAFPLWTRTRRRKQ